MKLETGICTINNKNAELCKLLEDGWTHLNWSIKARVGDAPLQAQKKYLFKEISISEQNFAEKFSTFLRKFRKYYLFNFTRQLPTMSNIKYLRRV